MSGRDMLWNGATLRKPSGNEVCQRRPIRQAQVPVSVLKSITLLRRAHHHRSEIRSLLHENVLQFSWMPLQFLYHVQLTKLVHRQTDSYCRFLILREYFIPRFRYFVSNRENITLRAQRAKDLKFASMNWFSSINSITV